MSLKLSLFTISACLLLSSVAARAETCSLSDGRQVETDEYGDVRSPADLMGFRLRERDDLGGFELFRSWRDQREIVLVSGCSHASPGFGPWGTFSRESEGRDSGGNCQSRNSDGTCGDDRD